jgi:hypothetical protein
VIVDPVLKVIVLTVSTSIGAAIVIAPVNASPICNTPVVVTVFNSAFDNSSPPPLPIFIGAVDILVFNVTRAAPAFTVPPIKSIEPPALINMLEFPVIAALLSKLLNIDIKVTPPALAAILLFTVRSPVTVTFIPPPFVIIPATPSTVPIIKASTSL